MFSRREFTSIVCSQFLWKLYAILAVLILFIATGVVATFSKKIKVEGASDVYRALHSNAVILKEVVKPVLQGQSAFSSQWVKDLRNFAQEFGGRYVVIRVGGKVILDTEGRFQEAELLNSRPEIMSARSHGVGTSTQHRNSNLAAIMHLAMAIEDDSGLVGFVRVSKPLDAIDVRLDEFYTVVWKGLLISFLFALLAGFLFARQTVEPLNALTNVAEKMADGNYPQSLSHIRSDEIGKLARAINYVAMKSQERMETITTDRNKLSAVLSGMVEGVIAVNHLERVLHMNATAARLLDVSLEDSLDKPIWEVTRVHEICEILNRVLVEETDLQGDFVLITQSRRTMLEMHASPLRDGQEMLVGAVVVVHDVSELQRLETVRSDFVANASHELKTPITAIRMVVETLIDDVDLSSEKREDFLQRMLNQTIRLSSIVNDLLALSRIESNSEEKIQEILDLRDIVKPALQAISLSADKKSVQIKSNLPAFPIEVRGDKNALSEMTDNLLDNALKYTPSDGEILMTLYKEESEAVLEIQDTGIGIEVIDQERIFERFYRVDKARSRELGGTGLGLSIVKHIVLAHDGAVSVESIPGKGSTFRVTLPCA